MPATRRQPRRLTDAELEQVLALTKDVCSASLKRTLGITDVKDVAAGRRAIRKPYSKEQRAFFTAHAPDGIGWTTCRSWARSLCSS